MRTLPLALALLAPVSLSLSSSLVGVESSAPTKWAFNPSPDTFAADAAFDLRSLNEPVAGQSGFVRVDANGDFILGDGRPARFWGITTYVGRNVPFTPGPRWKDETAPDLARHARFLAKRGVNLIKVLAAINPDPKKQPDAKLTDIRASDRDWIWRTVAAMKKEGIYTVISPWWPLYGGGASPAWNLGTTDLHGLSFFDDEFQPALRAWFRALYTEVNPHTGLTLAEDPAVAFSLIIHEDSLLFYTLEKVKGPPRDRLEAKYRAWLEKHHGSLAATFAVWEEPAPASDSPVPDLLLPLHELTPRGTRGSLARRADQTRFLIETQRTFFAEMTRFLREDLGVKSLVAAGDWRTADNDTLGQAERYTYLPSDIDGVDRYVGPTHTGKLSAWSISAGDHYASRSILDDPVNLPLNYVQTKGRPMVMLESGWTSPNAYESEGPLLVAAYSALTGFDGFLWFATRFEQWSHPTSSTGFHDNQPKWEIATPTLLGQFPAVALAYRRGDIARGAPVVEEHRSFDDLVQRRRPRLPDIDAPDANPAAQHPSLSTAPVSSNESTNAIDPRSFLVGPTHLVFDSDPANTRASDLAPFVDAASGAIRSNTGQLTATAARRLFTLDTPRAQAASAFWEKSGPVALSTITFDVRTPYATLMAVSLDDAPLATSKRVLLQTGTQCRPTGWSETATTFDARGAKGIAGHKIDSIGTAPWQVTRLDARVTIGNPALRTAWQLDENGGRVRELPLERSADSVSLILPPEALYTVLE